MGWDSKPFNPTVPLWLKDEVQFCKMKVSELCFTMSIHLTLLNLTLKNGYYGKFYITCFSPPGGKQK